MQVVRVGRTALRGSKFSEGGLINEPLPPGNFLERCNLKSLPCLYSLHELARGQKRLRRTNIKPQQPAAELLDREGPGAQIHVVNIGNLQFTARGRSELRSHFGDMLIEEIEARHRPFGRSWIGLFDDLYRLVAAVQPEDAEVLGLGDLVHEIDGTSVKSATTPEIDRSVPPKKILSPRISATL